MILKVIFLWVSSIALGYSLLAQQKPQYTQYALNQYVINPALSGIENYTDLRLSYRRQWAGLQGAPSTAYLSVHGALNKKDYRTNVNSFHLPGENPRGESYWDNYQAAEPHFGVGFQLITDKAGPLRQTSAYATIAYHIGIGPRTNVSLGFAGGINSLRLDNSSLDFGEDNPIDPSVYNSGFRRSLKPDLGAGIYLYSADYFVGVSAWQLLPQTVIWTDEAAGKYGGELVPHFFATAGYRFLVGEDFNLVPSVMLKYVNPVPVQADINMKLQYLDIAWIGAGYRTEEGVNALLGVNISNLLNVSYSYDFTSSGLNTVSNGSHEIMIGFLLGNRYGDWCPRNVW